MKLSETDVTAKANILVFDDHNLIDLLAVPARVNMRENKLVCLTSIDW